MEETPIPVEVARAGNVAEDISLVCALGFMVEDDNDPAPENIPQAALPNDLYDGQSWGWGGVDQQALFGAQNNRPKLNRMSRLVLELLTTTTMFLIFFLQSFLENVIMAETNKNLSSKLTFGELLVFIGIWFVISYSSPGCLNRREYWSSTKPNREGRAPFRLNDIMSGC